MSESVLEEILQKSKDGLIKTKINVPKFSRAERSLTSQELLERCQMLRIKTGM